MSSLIHHRGDFFRVKQGQIIYRWKGFLMLIQNRNRTWVWKWSPCEIISVSSITRPSLTENPNYHSRASFSDPGSISILNQHQKPFQRYIIWPYLTRKCIPPMTSRGWHWCHVTKINTLKYFKIDQAQKYASYIIQNTKISHSSCRGRRRYQNEAKKTITGNNHPPPPTHN